MLETEQTTSEAPTGISARKLEANRANAQKSNRSDV